MVAKVGSKILMGRHYALRFKRPPGDPAEQRREDKGVLGGANEIENQSKGCQKRGTGGAKDHEETGAGGEEAKTGKRR
jgi:hypothetical protein